MMKVAESTLSKANLTTVPSAIRKALELKAGDKLTWHITNQTVSVKKKEG